jgi:transcriptional regulator with XRE-family HTH domain
MPIPAYGVRFRQARLARQLTQVAVAKALRVSQSYIAQLEGGRTYPSAALAAKISKVLGAHLKVEGDPGAVHHLGQPAELFGPGVTAGRRPRTAGRPRLPIVGAPIPGDQERTIVDGQPYGSVFAPPQLENVPGAQALYVRGRSMEPRYFPGELIYVDPRRRPNPGDFVLVLVREPNYSAPIGYVRRYLGERSGKVRLSTLSPKREHLIGRDDLVGIRAIVGSGLL